MQIVYARKPKIHMLRKGKAVCGRHWLDGEEEGSKFSNLVDCKDCLRLLTQRAPDAQYLCERCGHAESDHPNKKCAAFARR